MDDEIPIKILSSGRFDLPCITVLPTCKSVVTDEKEIKVFSSLKPAKNY
jgi:hypothetical protein